LVERPHAEYQLNRQDPVSLTEVAAAERVLDYRDGRFVLAR
jgi:hypothetical protein